MGAGLLSGLGRAIENTGNVWMNDQMEKSKQERQLEYANMLQQKEWAREDSIRADELAREEAAKIVKQEYVTEGDKEYQVSYGKDKDGNLVELQRAESRTDPKTGRYQYKDGVVIDTMTGATSGSPLNTKMSDKEKQDYSLFIKLAGKEMRSEAEEKIFSSLAQRFMPDSGGNKPALADLIGQIKTDEAKRDPSSLKVSESKRGLLSMERIERDQLRENAPNPVRDAVRGAVDTVSDAVTDDGSAAVNYVKMRMQRKPSPADSRELEKMLLDVIESKTTEQAKQEARTLLKQLAVF